MQEGTATLGRWTCGPTRIRAGLGFTENASRDGRENSGASLGCKTGDCCDWRCARKDDGSLGTDQKEDRLRAEVPVSIRSPRSISRADCGISVRSPLQPRLVTAEALRESSLRSLFLRQHQESQASVVQHEDLRQPDEGRRVLSSATGGSTEPDLVTAETTDSRFFAGCRAVAGGTRASRRSSPSVQTLHAQAPNDRIAQYFEGLRRCVQKLNMNTPFERLSGMMRLRNVGAQTADRQCA